MKENQKIAVDIELSQNVLNENKDLNDCYNPKSKELVFELSSELPKAFVKDLEEFMQDEVIGKNQLALFNPLIIAINEMQQLKKIEYDPQVSDEEWMAFGENNEVSEIEIDDDGDILFDIIPSRLEKLKSPENIAKYNEKTLKAIKKTLAVAHDDSYQDCKDAIKVVGNFNTGLNNAKRDLKAPFSSVVKKIDNIYSIFKQESDNTKEAILNNFVDALKIEADKKQVLADRRDAKANQKIDELTKQNEENAKKFDHQEIETKKAQVFNQIKYNIIGGMSGDMAVNASKSTKEALEEKLIEIEKLYYVDLIQQNNVDDTILDADKLIEAKGEFEESKISWITILNREIKLRDEKTEAIITKSKLEDFKDGDKPPMFTDEGEFALDKNVPNLTGTEDEKFKALLDYYEKIRQEVLNFEILVRATTFTEQPYIDKQKVLLEDSLPKIGEWYFKLGEWLNNFYNKYQQFKTDK